MDGEGCSVTNENSRCSTPSSWASRVSLVLDSKETSPFYVLTTNAGKVCFLLVAHDAQWYILIHNDGQGNSPECIKLTAERMECENQMELYEDKIYRLGPCTKDNCTFHPEQAKRASFNMDTDEKVRSTSPTENEFQIVSPKKAAKNQKN
ncbi:hypothetical protein AVEN_56114-1 [Araneus ventricosus]|uniref:Uncharacterized protein n=1 Tax=Araneus ventricosus TaxID=182803 RepID=A0A4Y2GU99_ARAVE|nr:hypothetical protein AVEN_56114-1 [Araneus ventricosus]